MKLPEFDPIVNEKEEAPLVEETEQLVVEETVEVFPLKKKSHPWVKRVLLIVLAGVALLLLASSVVALCFEDKVADAVLTRVYRLVDTEVHHEKVSLNLWRKFPNVTVEVHGLTVDAYGKDKNLACIQRVYLQFNLLDVIRGHYRLKKAEIQQVDLNLHTYADATHSWDIFTPAEDTTETAFSLQLSAVQLSHLRLQYRDETSNLRAAAEVKKAGLKGDFTQEKFTVKYTIQLLLKSLDADTSFHWSDARIKSRGEVDVNLDEDLYLFRHCALSLNKEELLLNGNLHLLQNNSWQYTLRAEAKSLSVSALLQELPVSIQNAVDAYRIGGQLQLKLLAKGSLCEKPTLQLRADVLAREAEVWQKKNDVGLRNATFSARIEAATPNLLSSLSVRLKNFTADLPTGTMQAGLQMKNLDAPQVKFSLQSELRLQDLKAFLPQFAAYRMGGRAVVKLQFENVFPRGFEMSAESFRQAKLSGNLQLENGIFQLDTSALRMEDFVAQLTFSDQHLNITRFDGKIQGNECRLSAKVSPIFDFLFSKNQVLNVSAVMTSPYVDVDAFLSPTSASSSSTAVEGNAVPIVLTDRVQAEVKVAADRLKCDRFEATHLKGVLCLKNCGLSLRDFSMSSLGGKVKLKAEALPAQGGGFLLHADAFTDKVDIQRLFYVLHDFGQEQNDNGLTHRNIRGNATTTIRFVANVNSKLELLTETIDCDADMMVNDGRLIDFKVLQALSSFVSIEDLKDIRFETLKNKISIRNSVIQIPEMDIKNSLVNMNVSGFQTFKGDLHYNIKVHVNELLARKRRSKVRIDEFGTIEDDASKGMYLYLLVAGTTEHPEFRWNKEKAKEGFRENLQSQREELRSLFSAEKGSSTSTQTAPSVSTSPSSVKSKQRKEEKKRLNDARQKPSELEVGDDW